MNKPIAENLPKSKLKHFLVGRRSFGSKPIVASDKAKRNNWQ